MSTKIVEITGMDYQNFISLIKEAVASELQNALALKPANGFKSEKELLTRAEAKDLLKTSYTSLWKYDKDGLLPAKRIAGRVYYLRSELLNLLNGAA